MARKQEKQKPISTKTVSSIPLSDRHFYVNSRKTLDVLGRINAARDNFEAVDIIINSTPDGKMAYNVYLRLANQGIKIELKSATTGKIVKKYDNELRDFTKRIGKNNSCGLDGLLDQLHASAVARSGMAVEVIVNDDVTDIEEIAIIDPATINEFEWLPDKKRWAAYQSSIGGKKVDLYEGNFIWVPHQPKPGKPNGTLQFEPAIVTMTQLYQLIYDSWAVMNRIGFPRYKCEINRKDLLESATPAQRATAASQSKMLADEINNVEQQLRLIGKDSDLITFDSNKVEVLGGATNGSGIDVRAWFDVLEPLIVNSFQLTPVLMGRLTTGSYSLGTAEYSIVCDTIDTMRRASKRVLEEIIDLWARVKGYNVRATVTHNPIDWQTELDKLDVELKRMEKARRAEEYRWITHDEAAQTGIGSSKASEPAQIDMFEYLSRVGSTESNDSSNQSNTDQNNNTQDVVEKAKNEIVQSALAQMGFGDLE